MPSLGETRSTQTLANINVPTTTEVAAAILTGLTTDARTPRINFQGEVELLTGAGTTGVRVRLYRGGTSGTMIYDSTVETEAAGATVDIEVQATDAPGEVAGQQYMLTVAQAGATGNGTLTNVSLQAEYGA